MNKLKILFLVLIALLLVVLLIIFKNKDESTSASISVKVPTEVSVEVPAQATINETTILLESSSSEPETNDAYSEPPTNETYKGKLLTRDFVHSLDEIKYFPAATILLTDKWYTKNPSIKICERIVQLAPSVEKEDEFVTYWLVQKKKLSSKENNCDYLMNIYNFVAAKKELERLFKDKFENKNFIKRVYGKTTTRGPYIVIYENEKRDTDLIIDLNRLGPTATEYFIENWENILATVEDRGSLQNPGAAIKAALQEDKQLKAADRKDLMDNLVLWSKAGICVGLVAASITTTTVVSEGVYKFMTTTETMFKETKDGSIKNKSYCDAISAIAKQ